MLRHLEDISHQELQIPLPHSLRQEHRWGEGGRARGQSHLQGGINLSGCLSLTLLLKDVAEHTVRKLLPQHALLLLESVDRIASDMLADTCADLEGWCQE